MLDAKPPVHDAIIIGAGFSGICAAHKLKSAGITNFVLLEAASDVGGTWFHNTYPGCACDVPSLVYSFSFKQIPTWTEYYPKQQEIHAYLKDCVVDLNLTPYIRLRNTVIKAVFDQQAGLWTVHIQDQPPITSHVLLPCVGILSIPQIPNIPGRDTFTGAQWHTAQWNHAHSLTGQRVAIIGTGQSAIQVVKPVADVARHVTIFQRSAGHIMPRNNRPWPWIMRAVFRNLPIVQRFARGIRYWFMEGQLLGMHGRFPYPEFYALKSRRLRSKIKDPDLLAVVTPVDVIGCKRIGVNDDYYPYLQRPTVSLVPCAAARVTPRGIVDATGKEHELDVIVYATGFTAGNMQFNFDVVGVGGQLLNEVWERDGARAYFGGAVAGFPNMYVMQGPNTSLAHNSVVYMIEVQAAYLVDYVSGVLRLRACGVRGAHVDVLDSAQRAYNNVIERDADRVVMSSACSSWYLNKHGRNTTLFLDGTFVFRALFSRGVGWCDFRVSPESAGSRREWVDMQRRQGVRGMLKRVNWAWFKLIVILAFLESSLAVQFLAAVGLGVVAGWRGVGDVLQGEWGWAVGWLGVSVGLLWGVGWHALQTLW